MATSNPSPLNIIDSFRLLKGNTRVSVLFEPLWGIPYVLYNFYLSLYMKAQGVTDVEIGFIIAIGAIASAFFSMFSGVLTDALGRKRTTLIFDSISWPISILIYLFSHNFWLFALATAVNSAVKIVSVSWNLMVVEDADAQQQVAAYNLFNIINVSTGFLVPLAGLLVAKYGIICGERILLGYAAVSMSAMILGRNHCYRETRIGQQILAEHRHLGLKTIFKKNSYRQVWQLLRNRRSLLLVFCLNVLFNAYIPIGTFTSLYYAPYLTEALKLDRSAIAILGGAGPAVMFLVAVLIIPGVAVARRLSTIIAGVGVQMLALAGLILIPAGHFYGTMLLIIFFAIGYSISKPFLDSMLAMATAGKERAGIYSLYNTSISILSALLGLASGYLYKLHPALIYVTSIIILIACLGLLITSGRKCPEKAADCIG